MFPVSGSSYVYVPPSTGGGSTGGGTSTGYPLTTTQWNTLQDTITTISRNLQNTMDDMDRLKTNSSSLKPVLTADGGNSYHILQTANELGTTWFVCPPGTNSGIVRNVTIDLDNWDETAGVFLLFNGGLYESVRLVAEGCAFIHPHADPALRVSYDVATRTIPPGGYAMVLRTGPGASGITLGGAGGYVPSYTLLPNSA